MKAGQEYVIEVVRGTERLTLKITPSSKDKEQDSRFHGFQVALIRALILLEAYQRGSRS